MMELSDFKKIDYSDLSLMKEYMKAYFINRKFPRYYQNTMDMIYSPGKQKYYKEVDGCLLMAVKAYLHKPVLYFYLPPISLNGDIEAEKKLVNELDLNFRISEEDVALYGLDSSNLRRQEVYDEFIYKSEDYDIMPGKRYNKMRYYYNQAEKVGDFSFKTFENTNKRELLKEARELYHKWITYREFGNSYNIFKDEQIFDDMWRLTIGYSKGIPMYVSFVEYINDDKGLIVGRFGMYDNSTGIKQIKYYAQVHELRNVRGTFNIASGYGQKLIFAKQDLQEHHLLKLYDTKQTVVVDDVLWKSIGTERRVGLFG